MSTVQTDIDKIEFNGREWRLHKPIKNVKPNLALDTETVDGKPFLMASSNLKGTNHIFSDNIDDYLNFLTSKHFVQSNNFWYNLDYDMGGLIKMLPKSNVIELIKNGFTNYKDFKLKYIVSKMFKVSKENGNGSIHYDLAQFYSMVPLKILAERTRYNKVEVEDIANIDLERIKNDPDYKELIVNRCVIDARITHELADQFTNKVNAVVKNNRYLSAASITRAYFLTNLTKKLNLPSKRVMGYGLKSFHGGLIDTLKLGSFKNAFNIDISSAYPSVMANLYSCNGIWTTKPDYIPDTAYSFYKVEIDYYDDDVSPLWFNYKGKGYHPNGVIETYITQFEYEFLINKGFNVNILAASHLLKSKNHEQPFKELIKSLYLKRMQAKDDKDEIQLIYKKILNSAYGCTINDIEKIIPCSLNDWEDDGSDPWHSYNMDDETFYYTIHNVSTSMYNPVFAAYITSGCRIQLIDKIWKYRDKVISLNTDGAFLSSKIPIHTSRILGEWTAQTYKELKVMGNGRYFVYERDGTLNTDKSAFRGLRAAKRNMSVVDKQMADNPKGLGVSVDYEKPLKVRECVKNGNIEGINIWTPKRNSISFILDRRVWDTEIKANIDLLDNQVSSRPFNVNEIAVTC